MKEGVLQPLERLLSWIGIGHTDTMLILLASVIVALAVSAAVWWVSRFVLIRTSRRLSRLFLPDKTGADVMAVNAKRLAGVVAMTVFYLFVPVLFEGDAKQLHMVRKVVDVVAVVLIVRLFDSLFRLVFEIFYRRQSLKNRPLKGVLQIVRIVLYLIGAIVVVGVLIDRSPAKLLTGLGASAAVLGFIFKNSILGFVSSVVLSSDNMLVPGDWITMPQYNVDGTVTEVTINTIKIRNFDNTVTTLPPYLLTQESFKNWHDVSALGGRRIARSLEIDINTVKFCSSALLLRLGELELMGDYIDQLVAQSDPAATNKPLPITNIELYRYYLLRYIESLPTLNRSMTYMVRELQPTESGIPVQLYFFTDRTEWVAYEGVQADLIDHVMAVTPMFELKIFQRPSGEIKDMSFERADG